MKKMMHLTNKINLLILALFAWGATTTQAAVVAITNFDSTIKSGSSQNMTRVVWTGDPNVTVSSTILTTASANAGYFTTGFGATGFAPDQNLAETAAAATSEGPWTASFTLTVAAGYLFNLTDISFDWQMLTNSGGNQTVGAAPQIVDFDATINSVIYDNTFSTPANAFPGTTGEFTGALVLGPGAHTFTLTASDGGTSRGNNVGIDNLSFNGTVVVPEPSYPALLGFGLLVVAMRRRR